MVERHQKVIGAERNTRGGLDIGGYVNDAEARHETPAIPSAVVDFGLARRCRLHRH